MAGFHFPILTLDEILETWDFVTENDYKKPEYARWYKIYHSIFESITGEKPDGVEDKAVLMFTKISKTDNPELHEDSSRIIWFTAALQRAFMGCGVNDFTFKDIRDPKTKRLIILGSACINFLRFKTNRESIFQANQEKVERYKIKHVNVPKTNDELKKRLNIAQVQQAEKEPEIQGVQETIEDITEKIAAIQAKSQDLLMVISEERAKILAIKASKDQQKCEIMKEKQEGEKLQRNIVQSPQKVKDRLCRMREKVEALKPTKQEKIDLMSNYRNQLSQMKNRNSIADQSSIFMQSMKDDVQKRHENEEKIKESQEACQVNAHKAKAIKLQEEEYHESISLIQDRIQKLQLQKRTRVGDLEAGFSQMTEKREKIMNAFEKHRSKKEQLLHEKQNLLDKADTSKMLVCQKVNTIREQYLAVLEGLDQYHLSLKENM